MVKPKGGRVEGLGFVRKSENFSQSHNIPGEKCARSAATSTRKIPRDLHENKSLSSKCRGERRDERFLVEWKWLEGNMRRVYPSCVHIMYTYTWLRGEMKG